jgi:hypothetical protein
VVDPFHTHVVVEAQPSRLQRVSRAAWSPVDVVLWLVVVAAFVVLELVGFRSGSDSLPTFSQMVKRVEAAGGWPARLAVAILLVGSCVVLVLHWVFELF